MDFSRWQDSRYVNYPWDRLVIRTDVIWGIERDKNGKAVVHNGSQTNKPWADLV